MRNFEIACTPWRAYPGPMDDRTATTSRRMTRDPQDVWRRLTSPEGFEKWMGPGSIIEPEPGGQLVAADPESGRPKTGRVLEVRLGWAIRWIWRPLGEPGPVTEVEVELEPDDLKPVEDSVGDPVRPDTSGTLVTVTERPPHLAVPWPTGPAQACVAVAAPTGCAR